MQDAPQSATATDALSAPLSPIPAYRVRIFQEGVAERLRESQANGVSEAEVLASIRTERLALAQALDSETFRAAFARAYEEKFNALNPSAPLSLHAARTATDDIIAHRINDARQLAELVQQPEFIAAARAAEAKPRGDYQLPPEKIEEMITLFGQGSDGITHAQQSMAGHRSGHLALAEVYAEHGPLLPVLQQELTRPLQDQETARRVAADWLEARRKPAVATAQALQEDGQVYRAVLARVKTQPAIAAQPAPTIVRSTNVPGGAMATTVATGAMGLSRLNRTSGLTPVQIERRKDRREKASEWTYTMNHALSCGVTDIFIQPWVASAVSKRVDAGNWPRWLKYGFEHGHGHDHPPSLKSNLAHWFGGEVLGDVGAIPLTVGVQRFFPGFMQGLRNVLEPVFGRSFRKGAERDADRWAARYGVDDPALIADKAAQLYEYELAHLPQAAVWNAFAIPINLIAQRRLMHTEQTWPALIAGKAFGTLVSNTALIGGRAAMPQTFHHWDETQARLFGIRHDHGMNAPPSRVAPGGWQGRLETAESPELQPAR